MDGIHQRTNGGTFVIVMGPKLQQKKLWDQNCNKKSYGTKIATKKVMGPK